MNSISLAVFFAVFAVSSAGIIAPAARVLQGPSTRTTLVGPDGSVISSVAPGGQVITDASPGVVAYSAPVVAATASVVAAYSAPTIVAPAAPLVSAYAAPVVAGGIVGTRSVLAGPSGTITTSGAVAAPAVVAARSIWV